MLRQVSIRHLQQLPPSEEVEEIRSTEVGRLASDATSMLLRLESDTTMGQGRPLGWLG